MQYFTRTYPEEFLASLRTTGLDSADQVRTILTGQRRELSDIRKHLNELLRVAYRHKAVDREFLSRLRNTDWIAFASAYSELFVAHWLESHSLRLAFRPKTMKGPGEFRVVNMKPSLLVEVKALLTRGGLEFSDRIFEKLRKYSEELDYPVSVVFSRWTAGKDFRGKRFQRWLEFQIQQILSPQHTNIGNDPLIYEDSSGFHVDVKVIRTSSGVGVAGVYPMAAIRRHDLIKNRLADAYSQRPLRKNPYVVIFVDDQMPSIDDDAATNALFGTLHYVFDWGASDVSGAFRDTDGMYSPNRNRNLSAVGFIKFGVFRPGSDEVLTVFHNPWARHPIDTSWIDGPGVVHFIQDNGKAQFKRV